MMITPFFSFSARNNGEQKISFPLFLREGVSKNGAITDKVIASDKMTMIQMLCNMANLNPHRLMKHALSAIINCIRCCSFLYF